LAWRLRPAGGPVTAELRPGEWAAPVEVAARADAGAVLKPSRLVLARGEPVDGRVQSDAVVFPVGIARLADLQGPLKVESASAAEATTYALALDPAGVPVIAAEWDRRALEVADRAAEGGLAPE